MPLLSHLPKSVAPKLVPFFKTVIVYYVVFVPDSQPCFLGLFLKCLPILCLILFVYLHKAGHGLEYTYSRKIMAGLSFSCLGDALLIWPELLRYGIAAFSAAHLCYISAFGFEPLKLPIGVVIYTLAIFGNASIIANLTDVLVVGIPIYTLILCTTMWRAVARVDFSKEHFTLAKLSAAIGAILFGISDFVISVNLFLHPVPHAQEIIMSTYYAAQLGIALSIDDEDFSS